MIKKLFALALCAVVLHSCGSDYGKKVQINEHLEVYYKGNNVTEADAKKLGTYLADTWKEATNDKSLQLTKDSTVWVVRMVVDEEKVKADSTIDISFMAVQYLLQSQVFNNEPVRFILCDGHFKDIKTFKETATAQNPVPETTGEAAPAGDQPMEDSAAVAQ